MVVAPLVWRLKRRKNPRGDYFIAETGRAAETRSITLGYVAPDIAEAAVGAINATEETHPGRLWVKWRDEPEAREEILRRLTHEARATAAFGRGLDALFDAMEPGPGPATPLGTYAFEVFGPHRAATAPQGWRRERAMLRVVAASPLGKVPIGEIDPRDVGDFLASLRRADGEPMMWNSKRLHRAAIAAVLNYAYWPARHLDAPARLGAFVKLRGSTESQPRAKPFTLDELRAVVAAASDARVAGLIAFDGATGARPGELVSVRWEDVRGDGTVFIPGTKTRHSRAVIALSPMAALALERWRAWRVEHAQPLEGVIFPTDRGVPYSKGHGAKFFAKALATACRRAGVERRSPYDLRHTFASIANELRIPKETIARTMRDDGRTVAKYYDGSRMVAFVADFADFK